MDLDRQIVGREEELAAIAAFVDSLARGPATVVLEGDAGAGKTTLWRAGVEAAQQGGCLVLEALPSAPEAQLAFAGLGDLLEGVLDDVLAKLPEPQADALRVALLLERPDGAPPSERAVGAAVLSALRTLTAARQVLIAVDDVQWLDAPSASVLAYAWRRLRTESAGVLVTRRTGEPAPPALVQADESVLIEVGPLAIGALHRLLQSRLGLVLSRPALRRVDEVARGNPFFSLELGRALQRRGAMPAPGEPLPVPERLRDLVRDRLAALPDPVRDALRAVAALAQPTLALVTVATDGEEALRPAFDAHVLELDQGRVRFAHPILAAAAYGELEPLERRALHRRLAELVRDDDEAARHLALAAEGPDPDVADALERAAAHTRWRGATASAAELCEQACRLTPPERGDDVTRRTVLAARYRFLAGDAERAKSMLEQALASASPGSTRAEALTVLGRVQIYLGDAHSASEVSRQALAEADSLVLQAEAARNVAVAQLFMLEDLQTAYEHAVRAADLALRAGDRALYVGSLGSKGYLELVLGRYEAEATLRAALAAASETTSVRPDDRGTGIPEFMLAQFQLEIDENAQAGAALRMIRDEAFALGNEGSLPHILAELARAEYASGSWNEAEDTAAEAHEWAVQTGQRNQQAFSLSVRALVRASLGREAAARADAKTALKLAGGEQVYARIASARALGLLALSLARPEETVRLLAPVRERLLTAGVGDPGTLRFVPDEVEALIALGRLDDADAVLGWFEDRASALDRASAVAMSARCRGLLAAARGNHTGAFAELERALTQHGRVDLPFERSRTLLALGTIQRRAKRRSAARATLEAAIAGFEELGAALWARRARAELDRVGGRAPARGGLTPTERRVAELVAEGRSNKEVASALFVTPKTVGVTLSRIYAKLGIHSRVELAQRLPKL